MSDHRLQRRYQLDRPQPLVVEFHEPDCDCPGCEPYVPSVPPRLDAQAIAKLALGGIAFGHLVACVVLGPGTVWHILVTTLAGRSL